MTGEKGLILSLGDIVLDETTGEIKDSDGRVAGTLVGDARLVADDKFGSCLYFDGRTASVSLSPPAKADFRKGITVEFWIQSQEGAFEKCPELLGFGPLRFETDENEFIVNDWHFGSDFLAEAEGVWIHLAVTLSGNGTAVAYINGEPVSDLSGIDTDDRGEYWIAASRPDSEYHFHGKVARLRVYDRALSAAEIKADWAPIRSFEDLHPLSFRLYDEEQRGVIYVHDAGPGHPVTLEITNESGRKVELAAPGDATVSQYHHHFELRFRPGALSNATFKAIKKKTIMPAGWTAHHEQHPESGTVSLYLLKRSPVTLAATDALSERDTLTVTLDPLSADPTGGARPTPVELHPGPLTHSVDRADDPAPIPGGRSLVVEIVSHRGRKYIPLHVGFVTANTVLNDGSPNDLVLRIKNVSHDKNIPLKPQGESASHFTVAIEHGSGPAAGWALTETRFVEEISLYARRETGPEILVPTVEDYWREARPDEQIPKGQWVISVETLPLLFPSEEEISGLKAQESIYLRLANIKTTHHTGSTSLHVSYEDIPGYWDGSFALTIQKSPLVFSGENVGIGTTEPKSKLAVVGGVTIGDKAFIKKPASEGLFVQGNVGIGVSVAKSKLAVAGGVMIGDKEFVKNSVSDGLFVQGNVGIGVGVAKSKLAVAGAVSIGEGNKRVAAPPNGLLVQGRVDLEEDLNLRGTSRILFDQQTGRQAAAARIFWGEKSPMERFKVGRNGLWMTVGDKGVESGGDEGGMFLDEDGLVIFNSGDKNLLRLYNEDNQEDCFVVDNAGKVTIGSGSRQAHLTVNGSILMGANGALKPASGCEPLHIVLGRATFVDEPGYKRQLTDGNYWCQITFTEPFSDTPPYFHVMGDSHQRQFNIPNLSSTGFSIHIQNEHGSNRTYDCPFTFIAIGPR